MFFRIYIGLLAAIGVALIVSYIVYDGVNEHRLHTYNESIYAGTFYLMRDGLQRHQGVKREEWLSIVRRLSGLELALKERVAGSGDRMAELSASTLKTAIRFDPIDQGEQYRVTLDIDMRTSLEGVIDSTKEQQYRVAMLLILNELGRFNARQAVQALPAIQQHFPFPIRLQALSALSLDTTQRKRVKNGEIAVVLAAETDGSEAQYVYASLDARKRDVIILGPIPLFVQTPLALLFSLLTLVVAVIGVAAYVLVRHLEVRLKTMSASVERFGPADLSTRVHDTGGDTIADLAGNFNVMAERIARLVEDQKYVSQAVSHELRTPIARMKFRLDMLESQLDDPAGKEKVEGLRRDVTELNTLVDEALFFQQIDSLKNLVDEAKTSVDLRRACEDVISNAQHLSLDKNVTLEVPESVDVLANPVYLKRLIQNLVTNALRHCQQSVLVNYREEQQQHVLLISDDGEGIDEQHRMVLFQPFQRADTSRNRKLGGYGLGLAIVQRIASLHGGNVSIHDSELGGAAFRVTWPKKQ